MTNRDLSVVDLFAGPGGWDLGMNRRVPTSRVVGLERDDAACQTRRNAGLDTIQCDIAATPVDAAGRSCDVLIASPPCPGFSTAGSKRGWADLPVIRERLIQSTIDGSVDLSGPWQDERSPLTLEPMRFILGLDPVYVAMEQVPAVLPIWHAYEVALAAIGYASRSAVVTASDHGVGQRRRRAVIMARKVRPEELWTPALPAPVTGPSMVELLDVPETWVLNTGRRWPKGGDRSGAQSIPASEIAPTVTSRQSQSQWWNHGEFVRSMSIGEASAMQSFPPDFEFLGSASDQWMQVGNAVPPVMAAALLDGLLSGRVSHRHRHMPDTTHGSDGEQLAGL